MRTSLFLGLALALGSSGLLTPAESAAQSVRAMRAQAEGSMVLSGSIDIATDGSVEGFRLKDEAKVEPYLQEFVKRNVASWRFEPTLREGKAVPSRTPVNLRLLAKTMADDKMAISISSASFEDYDPGATDVVTATRMTPPSFPEALFELRGAGEVSLLINVGRDGTVAEVAAEQVNVHVLARGPTMQRMRDVMARSAVVAARKWTFRVPTTGDAVADPSWTVRVPVRYSYEGSEERYGKWQAYVPGPKMKPDWRSGADEGHDVADTLPDGGVYMVGINKGPKLLTPLQG